MKIVIVETSIIALEICFDCKVKAKVCKNYLYAEITSHAVNQKLAWKCAS